jgi:hypothetical protein
MKLMRTIVAASAAILLTASLALACDGKAMASGGGCHGKATATASGEGCHGKGATMASGKGCCAKNAEPTMASVADMTDASACKYKVGAVNLKGTVLCNHCNLHKSETCQTMFKTENGCLFALGGDKAQSLREAAVGGGKLVRVKGEVNDKGELVISSYRVIRTIDGAASAM